MTAVVRSSEIASLELQNPQRRQRNLQILPIAGVMVALLGQPAWSQTTRASAEARSLTLVGAAGLGLTAGPTDTMLSTGQTRPAQPPPAAGSQDLRVEEAVARALERNLDIAVERLNPQTFDLSLAGIRATYRPLFNSTLALADQVQLPTNQLVGGTRVENQSNSYNTGVSQELPWFGGNVAVSWNNRRLESTSLFNTFNPQYNTTLSAVFTQPLLRDFRTDAIRTQLRVTQINRDISDIQLRATITNTLAAVRNAYWDLVFATRAVEVAQRSLELAEKLVEDNKVRVEVGAMAPIDVVQAEAEAANRRLARTQAEATRQTAELSLKRLIVSGTDDPLWRNQLNPVDVPTLERAPLDIDAAVSAALAKRTDLAQGRRQLEANDVSMRQLRNLTLPALDLLATYGLQGIGGTQFVRSSGVGGQILNTIPGGFGDALQALGDRSYPNWNLQFQLSYPIGQSATEANYARAKVSVQQTQAQIRQLELQVATEVTNTGLQVRSNLQRVEAAAAARELSERRLEAEQSKFEVGLSTNFFVVQAQRDLLDAQNTELRALSDYRKSLVDFERVQETSLSRAGITIVNTGAGAGR